MVKKKSLNTPWNIPRSRIGKFNSVQGQFSKIYQWLSAIPIEIQAELFFLVEIEKLILKSVLKWKGLFWYKVNLEEKKWG